MKTFFTNLICVLLSCLFLLCASAADRSSLFIGDGVWQDDALLPFLEADNKQLLPVSAFAELGVQITLSEALGSLLLQKGNAFLSYNLNFGRMLDESGNLSDAKIYRYGGEIYLAPEPICYKFGLSFSTVYASDGYLVARLTDGSERLKFHELLSLYIDSGETELPYLYNPTGKTVGGIFLYPILLRPSAESIQSAVRKLGTHSATFVLSPDDIPNYTSVLPEIYANGHTIAYYMDEAASVDPNTFYEKMERANALLFSVTGKTVRIYVSPEIYAVIPTIDGYHKKSCRMHLLAEDLASTQVVDLTLAESLGYTVFNFSLASDQEARSHYTDFFRKFDGFNHLRSMPMTESSSNQ